MLIYLSQGQQQQQKRRKKIARKGEERKETAKRLSLGFGLECKQQPASQPS